MVISSPSRRARPRPSGPLLPRRAPSAPSPIRAGPKPAPALAPGAIAILPGVPMAFGPSTRAPSTICTPEERAAPPDRPSSLTSSAAARGELIRRRSSGSSAFAISGAREAVGAGRSTDGRIKSRGAISFRPSGSEDGPAASCGFGRARTGCGMGGDGCGVSASMSLTTSGLSGSGVR